VTKIWDAQGESPLCVPISSLSLARGKSRTHSGEGMSFLGKLINTVIRLTHRRMTRSSFSKQSEHLQMRAG
jgi:hypothetical protein